MQKGTMLGIIALVVVVSYIGYNEVELQAAQAAKDLSGIPPTEQRFLFEKNFQDYLEINSIDHSANFPLDLIIFNWDKLTPQTQNAITSEANKAGYSVITP